MKIEQKRVLIIQTAFIGDVILSTCLIAFFKNVFPNVSIDFVLRKSNASILEDSPDIRKLIMWDKDSGKIRNLRKVIKEIRATKYDVVVNAHRFASSGLMALFSKADQKIGYDKNPLSVFYDVKITHDIGRGTHEVDRLMSLVKHIDDKRFLPQLHLPDSAVKATASYKSEPYIVLAPTSVWFTKQFPAERWVEFIDVTAFEGKIYLVGAPADREQSELIRKSATRVNVINLCGELKLLESASLMRDAVMNYTNDSGPMHLCTALDAPVKAIYCSTVPDFGFGPLSSDSEIIETSEVLACRPCGLHGHKACPEGHFKCAKTIDLARFEIKNK